MRNAATHNGKDLAREIALLKQQLDDLADTVNGTGSSIVARGEAALEETLKSARELVAKYGDTAKSIRPRHSKAQGQGHRHPDRADRDPPAHHLGGNHRRRFPRRLALSSALADRLPSHPSRPGHR